MPANDMPLGACPKCQQFALINCEGAKICPSCDTKTGTRSGLVNKVKDPGKRMDANGKITGKIEGGVERQAEFNPSDKAHKMLKSVEPLFVAEPIDVVAESLDNIDKVLCNMRLSDFADLREAKKVMKYRKKLAMFKLELQEFLG